MGTDTWRERLEAALKEKKLSKRAASLRAGKGDGYVHSILAEGKDPTIDNLKDVCDAVGVSMAFILHGFDMTPEDERILAAMHEGVERRDAVLTLLGAKP